MSQTIDIGTTDERMACGTQGIPSKIVDQDDHEVRAGRRLVESVERLQTQREAKRRKSSSCAFYLFIRAHSPERVGPAHVPYQLTYFGSNAWSSGPTPSALPSPISSEPTTVPADDRLRFHDDEDALPVSPDSAQQHPKPAVDLREPRPFHRTAEDGELLPKSDILESQLATSLEGRDESGNQRRNHAGMVPADRRLIKFGARG